MEDSLAEKKPIRIKVESKRANVIKAKQIFIPKFDFKSVEVKEAANEVVKIAEVKVPPAERQQPQIVSIIMTGDGICTIVFSRQMMYSKNWVNKFLKDNKLNDIDK